MIMKFNVCKDCGRKPTVRSINKQKDRTLRRYTCACGADYQTVEVRADKVIDRIIAAVTHYYLPI